MVSMVTLATAEHSPRNFQFLVFVQCKSTVSRCYCDDNKLITFSVNVYPLINSVFTALKKTDLICVLVNRQT